MKKTVHFSKGFLASVIISSLLIISGIVIVCIKGLNFGLDFKPGMIEEIKVAPAQIALTYKGSANVNVETSSAGVSLVVSGVGEKNNTYEFLSIDNPTVSDMVKSLSSVPGVTASLIGDGSKKAEDFVLDTQTSTNLSKNAVYLHLVDKSSVAISADEMRNLLSELGDVQVKEIGTKVDDNFQIRVGDDGTDPEVSKTIQSSIAKVMNDKFGEHNWVVVKTDFIGSNFSGKLMQSSIILVLVSLLLIWIYVTIRFKWDFAIASILGIVHDALIIITFLAWTRIELDSLTIAAILTIVGYSINNTVVVLDRVRENTKVLNITNVKEMWDISNTEMLTRSVITTVTTMLAALSLLIFTSGSMRNFAACLMVGLVSGFYSSIMIAGSFLSVTRRKGLFYQKGPKAPKNTDAQV
ncbi:MAG: protein translocase subunit SecF [Treponemataceae bacterium]|nr:protein translocase subunit SecF [Treponemataceae bacterium]